MSRRSRSTFPDIEELELPKPEELTEKFEFPEPNDDGKIILKNIPNIELDEKRTINGSSAFISFFGGTTGNEKDGYKDSFDKAGRILIIANRQKCFIEYLDLVAVLKLTIDNLEFVKYQVLRNRADIKEQITRKQAFIS